MALGDGIRRNLATVSALERDRFIAAFRQLDMSKAFPDGVSYWDKQDQIHQATHVHGGAAFLPWHRELCNRLETLLREVDPDVSLHYWDWTTDPQASPDGAGGTVNLFSNTIMGSANGRAGAPFETFDNNGTFNGSRNQTGNPADPPQEITRNLRSGAPAVGNGVPSFKTDVNMIASGDTLAQGQQWSAFRNALEDMHNDIHSSYIRGTIGPGHSSFEDPFVFLLHANIDRLWAMWQTQPGKAWRLDPAQVYGNESATSGRNGILTPLDPWAGNPTNDPQITRVRPWAPPENQQVVKDSKHPSVVRPPCYDTLPTHPGVVTLDTPTLTFNDVPAGETTARAIVFSALACDDVHLSVTAGPTVLSGPASTNFAVVLGNPNVIEPRAGNTPPKGRIWLTYTGTQPGDTATGTVTVHCNETNQDFVVPITANTIARPTVAVCLSLDQSGSMDDPAGSLGAKRIDVLREAASRFVEVVQRNNGLGIVRFDHDAYPGFPVTRINSDSMFDPDRIAALNAVQAHATNLNGWTSIGDGVALARTTLNPVTGYDQKAIIVFTDGLENTPQYLSDVMGSIDSRTYAIGLGTETQVSTQALTQLTNGTGGYLLLTGHLSANIDDYFRLTKYFLQILAGVTNNTIVLDPNGYVAPGMKLRIPFVLNEADIDSTAILLTDIPAVEFALETPDGDVMDPSVASGLGQTFIAGTNMNYYRFTLPLALGAGAHAGTWYALLTVDEVRLRRYLSKLDNYPDLIKKILTHGVRYSLSVHSFSSLKFEARLSQSSLVPGATMTLRANLSEYGLPIEGRADVQAELVRPDGSQSLLTLAPVEPGVYETSLVASIQGIYHFRVVATGYTLRSNRFTREQLLTGAVFQGGDVPPPNSHDDPRTRDEQLCNLVECLLKNDSVRRFMKERGLELDEIMKCWERYCQARLERPHEGQTLGTATNVPDLQRLSEALAHPDFAELRTMIASMMQRKG